MVTIYTKKNKTRHSICTMSLLYTSHMTRYRSYDVGVEVEPRFGRSAASFSGLFMGVIGELVLPLGGVCACVRVDL